MNTPIRTTLGLAALALTAMTSHAQHRHLNAGAFGTNQNDQLYFVNGRAFASGSGYVKQLDYTNSGKFAGYYQGGITFTAQPGTTNNGGPAFGHAALGSFLQAEIVSVAGPAGGAFGFWESTSLAPLFSGASGFNGSYRFDLSDTALGAGLPGADPFGHIHGRRFTATTTGAYMVGFRIHDTSANGLGGLPIHSPADVLLITFSAVVPEPGTISLLGLGIAGAVAYGRLRRKRFE